MNIFVPLCLAALLAMTLCAKFEHPEKRKDKKKGPKDDLDKMLEQIEGGASAASDGKGNKLKKGKSVRKQHKIVTRIQQTYEGLPVLGYDIVEREFEKHEISVDNRKKGEKPDPNGPKVIIEAQKKVSGTYVEGLDRDIGKINHKKLNPKQELEQLKKKHGNGNVQFEEAESVIQIDEETGKGRVAYLVSAVIEDENGTVIWPAALYDTNGDVVVEYSKMQGQSSVVGELGTGPGGNSKTGCWNFGSFPQTLAKLPLREYRPGNCEYNTPQIKVSHALFTSPLYSRAPFSFPCYNQASDAVNGGCSPLNDLDYFGHQVYDMFDSWYGTTPWPGFDKIELKAHTYSLYENAAYVGPPYNFVFFGDGQNTFYPLTCLDIVAHEIGHGVTGLSSKLQYYSEHGGMNEAFSDMMGKAAERFARGYNPSTFNWGLGYDCWKSGARNRESLRCMDDPTCDGLSIDHIDNYYNGMDVHYSSGIYNKVFYLLSKVFENDLWDAFDLFYIANTELWSQYTNFLQGAEYTLEAMDEMKQGLHNDFTYSWIDSQDIVDAFDEVGICCSRSGTSWTCTQPVNKICNRDLGLCASFSCENGGHCEESAYFGTPQPSCRCLAGYTGLHCEYTGCSFTIDTNTNRLFIYFEHLSVYTGMIKCQQDDCTGNPCLCTMKPGTQYTGWLNYDSPPTGCGVVYFNGLSTSPTCVSTQNPASPGFDHYFGCQDTVGSSGALPYVCRHGAFGIQESWTQLLCGAC